MALGSGHALIPTRQPLRGYGGERGQHQRHQGHGDQGLQQGESSGLFVFSAMSLLGLLHPPFLW